MFAKKLLHKATTKLHHNINHQNLKGCLTPQDLDFQTPLHYGIPSTASLLAFDPIQRLLAIATLDGRIKVIGGDNIEALLLSPKQLPFKYLEFLANKGFLVSVSNDNQIQVWNLENRSIASTLQWSSNITSFSVIYGSFFMYVGDDNGLMSVLKHEEDGQLLLLPYHISAQSLTEAAESSCPDHQTVVGVLHQPSSSGNRVLVAYESGLIILWDIFEAQAVVVRGDKDLELKNGVVGQPEHDLEEKEITALCWASSNGTVVAAGYIDGDIMFWKTSTTESSKKQKAAASNNNVVRLQLSSAERKLPVIVLHWSANTKSQNDCDGQLFVYGGDEIGSDEVLTVLSLEWSPGMETLRCVGRAEVTLIGSFADMSLLPSAINNTGADLLVLTSPGHLQLVNHKDLSDLTSQHEKRITLSSLECPAVVPTLNPVINTAKLISLLGNENTSKFLLEIATNLKASPTQKSEGSGWPISGGIVYQFNSPEGYVIERIYIAGYMDGSVRIWDATSPVLSILCVIGAIKDVEVSGSASTSPVSELSLCSSTSRLAVGNQLGLIRVYNLDSSSKETDLHVVTGTKQEVLKRPEGGGPTCIASFHLIDSPVQSLQYLDHGVKLAVAHECGRVAVLDMNSFSVSFLTESLPSPSSPVISVTWQPFVYNGGNVKSPKGAGPKNVDKNLEKLMFVATKDAKLYVFDGNNRMINSKPMQLKKDTAAISMHIIEGSTSIVESVEQKESTQLTKDVAVRNEPANETDHMKSGQNAMDSLVLLCCMDALCLYRLKSMVQGNEKPLVKVKLEKHCCWTSTFKKDEKTCGLVLLYQSGELEIRSLPDLELVKVTSLMSTLRWSYKANMQRTVCCTENGQMAMINGSEVAFLSLLKNDDDGRVMESSPSLHDKVLAAAVEAVISSSQHQKKKQGIPGALVNILKGFKGGKTNNNVNFPEEYKLGSNNLDDIFSKNPFPGPLESNANNEEEIELDIDDIEIDEPVSVSMPTSSHTTQKAEVGKKTEREMLLDGDNEEPRVRTREEIIAKYRKNAGDASSIAAQARNKLLERQEKLDRISKRTQDLSNEAEDFASLANELVKAMERRKWWQI